MSYVSIKDWAADDRPREKLLLKGINSLSDAELLAILIGSGTHKISAVELSRKILSLSNNYLSELGKHSVSEFMKIKGIGKAKAISIVAALELGRRRSQTDTTEKHGITSSKDVFNYFQPFLTHFPFEETRLTISLPRLAFII